MSLFQRFPAAQFTFDLGQLVVTWWPLVLGVFVSILAIYFAVRALYRQVQRQDEIDPEEAPSQGLFGPLTPALARQIPEGEQETKDFQQLLRQAGFYHPNSRNNIYALRFALLFGTIVVAAMLGLAADYVGMGEYTIPILVIGGLLAAGFSIIPRLFVFFRRRGRIREIRNALADMMDMMAMCIGGGMPIYPALNHVANNLTGHPALARELKILRRQAEVGSLRKALDDFAKRLDMPEARQVANLLSRGERLGSKITGSLIEQADYLRNYRRQQATMQANKTPVKLTLPLLLCFAPAALILLISPALLEINDFFFPREGESVLAGNSGLNANPVVQTLGDLEQEPFPPATGP